MTALRLRASSQTEEAGFLAMRDLAAVADDVGIDYRLVGGQMVRLHVALADVPEPVVRVTQDADMGIAAMSARDPALVPGLEALGYARPAASNRFMRTTDGGLRLVIDVLAPAYGRRLIPNQQHGDMVLDEIPGLSLALARPGEQLDLTVTTLDDTVVTFPVVIPEINSALCLKALSWSSRLAAKDAVDVWRLLRAHRQRIPKPVEWRESGVQGDAATVLRTDFGRPAGGGVRAASSDRAEQAEVRALTLSVLRA
ncbi:hypothetical protein [uncultured Jatrophihabitans sp.]|uniref:hypothetical protein n=1 Tax=uncultured Jatrophihabitans sp. TaxID=1610747 RepID=UPI0035CADCEC